jgi:hypothetical protein
MRDVPKEALWWTPMVVAVVLPEIGVAIGIWQILVGNYELGLPLAICGGVFVVALGRMGKGLIRSKSL